MHNVHTKISQYSLYFQGLTANDFANRHESNLLFSPAFASMLKKHLLQILSALKQYFYLLYQYGLRLVNM